jgi:hypothetical protein
VTIAPPMPGTVPGDPKGRLAIVSIGASVLLLLAGAILRFAVTWTPKNVDLQVIGVILMIGGAVGLIASIAVFVMKRRREQSAEVFEQRHYIEPPR